MQLIHAANVIVLYLKDGNYEVCGWFHILEMWLISILAMVVSIIE